MARKKKVAEEAVKAVETKVEKKAAEVKAEKAEKKAEVVEKAAEVKAAVAEKAPEVKAEVVEKAAEVKAEKPAKKAPAKKAAPKKIAPKKPEAVAAAPAAPAAPETKVDFFVEFGGVQVAAKEVVNNVKATIGKEAKEIAVYLKPEESKAYFVADGESGSMDVYFC